MFNDYTEIYGFDASRADLDSDDLEILTINLDPSMDSSPFTWSLPNETFVLEIQYNKRFDYWEVNAFTENLFPLILGRRLMPNVVIPIPFIKGQVFYYSGNIEYRDITWDTIKWYGKLYYIQDKLTGQ
jgi:hypothetical protein